MIPLYTAEKGLSIGVLKVVQKNFFGGIFAPEVVRRWGTATCDRRLPMTYSFGKVIKKRSPKHPF
jgi:hypothetical protein